MTTDGRPFTPDDLLRLPSVSDARIAPGGAQVAYVVATLDAAADEARSQVWLVATAGGEPRQISDGERDGSPRWSPDAQTLAYVRRADQGQHILLRPLDGGDARAIGEELRGGIGSLSWSPDGRFLAFTSRDVPAGDRDKLPQVTRRLRYLHNGGGYVGDGNWRVWVLDVQTGEAAPISDPDWHHFQPAWSPDSERLALVSTRRPDWDLEWVWDIYSCRRDGSDLRQLTGSQGVAIAPAWSPDGGRIAYLDNRAPWTGTTVDYHLWTIAADGGEPVEVSAALDRGAVTSMLPGDTPPPRWSPDGRTLFWLAREAGFAQIMRVGADGGPVRAIVGGEGSATHPTIANDGRLAYTWSDWRTPPEVWVCGPDGEDARRLTEHTRPLLSELALGEPRTFSMTAPDGLTVESWLWLPPGASESDGPFPTLLQLHGGPHGAVGPAFATQTQLLASHGYAVVGVNFRGSGGYGQAFADVILADWGTREFADAMAAIDDLIARGVADPERLGVYGGSYGGFMTNVVVTHTARFKAAVTMATIASLETLSYLIDHWESIATDNGGYAFTRHDYYRAHSPLTDVERITTPLLILHGASDHTCAVAEADMLFAALRQQRKEVELVRYPGEAHGFSRAGRPSTRVDAHRRLLAWFRAHIPADAPA
ncbi:MAG TPA: S9 family peptidase [Thermomicrobiaceae bacterium]|nr:S9 family peptidase [Thermomicrobiaceae bacterium]